MQSLSRLQVHVGSTPEGGPAGHCTEISSLEDKMIALVEFEIAEAPALALGQRIELVFRAPELDLSIGSEALIVRRTDEPGRRTYGFRCDISKRAFLHLLSRRRAPRVRIPPSRAVRVKLLDVCDGAPEATLYDASAIGLSILVEPRFEQHLYERHQLRVALWLPGDATPIEMSTSIRHRRLLETGILYGLEIEGARPESARAKERFLVCLAGLLDVQKPH